MISEVVVAIRELESASVVVLGRRSELTASMVAALRRHGVTAIEEAARGGSRERVTAVESMILVVDGHRAETLFGERPSYRSRRRVAAWENDACDLVVTTALDTGARRILAVCDGRRLTFGQRTRAVGVFRRLARRIDYECAINGLAPVATSYGVIDADCDVARLAEAAGRSTLRSGASPAGPVPGPGARSTHVRIQGLPGRTKAARKVWTGPAWMAEMFPPPSQKEPKPCPKSLGE